MAACRNLRQLDQRVSDAVKVRRELDLRIGRSNTPHVAGSHSSVQSSRVYLTSGCGCHCCCCCCCHCCCCHHVVVIVVASFSQNSCVSWLII